jgi:hypothetical protein
VTVTATIPRQAPDLGTEEARELGAEASIYLYPLVPTYGPGNSRRRMSSADPCSPAGVCSASSRP